MILLEGIFHFLCASFCSFSVAVSLFKERDSSIYIFKVMLHKGAQRCLILFFLNSTTISDDSAFKTVSVNHIMFSK